MRPSVFCLACLMSVPLAGYAQDRPLILDFARCRKAKARVFGPQGSTTYEVVGRSSQGCVVLFGQEVESPGWDGYLDTICVVPRRAGAVAFPTNGTTGADVSVIAKHCARRPSRPAERRAP